MATSFVTSQPVHAWPAILKPSDMTLQLQFHTSSFTSPFTRTSQTQALPGALFRLTATFPPSIGSKTDQTRAWMAKLRGATGRFYWPANGIDFNIPSAYAAETVHFVGLDVSTIDVTSDRTDITIDATQIAYWPVFTPDGESQDRTRITGTLWLNSNRVPLKPGAYVSFDDAEGWRHLHVVVDLIMGEGSSPDVIVVEPPMRAQPTSSTAIHVRNPSGIFRLNDDDQGAIRQSAGMIGALGTVEATQAFPLRVVA